METKLPSATSAITVSELQKLLIALLDSPELILIRIHKLGHGWNSNFMRVVMVTKKGVIFNDETINEFVNISDIALIKEFELSKSISIKRPALNIEMNTHVQVSGD